MLADIGSVIYNKYMSDAPFLNEGRIKDMMKRMRRQSKKKLLSALLTMAIMAVCMSGCGNTSADADSVAEDTEATVDEIIDKVEENKDGNTPSTDKPAETASPTAEPSTTGKPESTAEPTAAPTEKPQATATPEPTAPPHVHEYAESITKQPTCAEAGVKTLTCSCGEVKTEAIPATGHDFVTQYKTVEHEALGHVEQVQVQVGTTRRTEYECAYCGARFDSAGEEDEHQKSFVSEGNIEHVFARTIAYDYDEPIYETQSSWIVDVPAWTENVPNGSVCSKCGVAGP
ncbi:MAG: hypothetical protein NC489_22320 [Ruminococcus flavefaciens]|nr:hypothetical protein [Ruminococcus flavefaciens]